MHLWIDELREPPEGHQWAKTITEAIRFLAQESIESVSIDYDISILVSIGKDVPQEVHSTETYEAVAWFIASAYPPGSFPIEIHSLNPEGTKLMTQILEGWQVSVNPMKQEHSEITPNDQNVVGT